MTTRLAYSLTEAAEQASVSVLTLRREIRAGEIRARRVRGRTVVLHTELERYLASRAVVPTTAETARQSRPKPARGKVVRLIDLSEFSEAAR